MRDRQQTRAYDWEGEWPTFTKKTLTQDECRTAIVTASGLYNIPVPVIRFLPGKRGHTWYDPNDHTINLRPRHCNLGICLHETAHAIHSHVTGDEAHEIHGPEWLAIYINLLERFEIASLTALTASAEAHALVYADLAKHSPRRLRATYRGLWRKVQRERESS